MNKRELALLEKAFVAEMGGVPLQTKSKLAEKLVDDGMLERVYHVLEGRPPVIIKGFGLTHAGRYEYGKSCEDVYMPEIDNERT